MASDPNKVSVLVLDRKPTFPDNLAEIFNQRNCSLAVKTTPEEALSLAEQVYFDVVLATVNGQGSLDEGFIFDLKELFPQTLVVVLAEKPSVDESVRFMRAGAINYVPRPHSLQELGATLDEVLADRRMVYDAVQRNVELHRKYDVHNIVGTSRPMQDVFRLIHKVAAADATVLIMGESGTGKELVARAIHHHSPRRENPMVPVNCGAIPHELLESELFGHEKGAFTGAIKTRLGRFELAEGGTIFLDEIGDMSPMLQVKLLRVLQERQFERVGGTRTITADIRVIAATNQNLEARVKEAGFREDLYYRLNVVPIVVPPLRERRSDIPLLCRHFLAKFARGKGMGPRELHSEVMDRLMRHHWPGNVRELENMLERMAILCEGDLITPEDLPPHLAGPLEEVPPNLEFTPGPGLDLPDEGLDFNEAVDAFERDLIMKALERTGWVKNQAATLLKLNRTTLVEKIKKKGLNPPGLD